MVASSAPTTYGSRHVSHLDGRVTTGAPSGAGREQAEDRFWPWLLGVLVILLLLVVPLVLLL